MIESWNRKINQRVGEEIYLSALRDLATGKKKTARPGAFLGFLSVLILISPALLAVVGISLLFFGFPSVIPLIIGGTCLAAAWFLRPRKEQPQSNLLGRSELPNTFEILDALSIHLDGPKVDYVSLDNSFNAYAALHEGKAVIGIGSLMWLVTDRSQRVALLAHEIAHLVNKDAARKTWAYKAEEVLTRWYFFVEPTYYRDIELDIVMRESHGVIADFLIAIFRGVLELLFLLLMKLNFADSQKAEYKADALSVRAAGKEAVLSLLDLSILFPPSETSRKAIMPRNGENGTEFLNRLAATVSALSSEEKDGAIALHERERLTLDSTHPPTIFRKAFVRGLPDEWNGKILASIKLNAVEEELVPHIERLGSLAIADQVPQ